MPEAKVQPDVISYSAAISACEKGGQWQQAFKLFEAIAAISACEKGGQWQQAFKLFEAMPKVKVQPNMISYSAAISACEKGGQWQQAFKLFEAMPKVKVQPNMISYSAAISACEKGGQWQQALKLFESMFEANVPPDLVSYNALFDCAEIRDSAIGRALFEKCNLPEILELKGCGASEIDLHDLSEGFARAVLCHWLSTAIATKLEQEKELTCLIVTGYGKSRKEWDTTDMRQASLKLLQDDLGLQAAVLRKNQGAIQVCLGEADLPALRRAGASFN
ncbi:unnamed protein product [Durusdinium trenchii]|uniref:Pentatricopeptide repeat-containing protein n=1 Tax=Durusdinium trenchii TaxID=1381693 RepID=A0ABP0LSL9_9DINO